MLYFNFLLYYGKKFEDICVKWTFFINASLNNKKLSPYTKNMQKSRIEYSAIQFANGCCYSYFQFHLLSLKISSLERGPLSPMTLTLEPSLMSFFSFLRRE